MWSTLKPAEDRSLYHAGANCLQHYTSYKIPLLCSLLLSNVQYPNLLPNLFHFSIWYFTFCIWALPVLPRSLGLERGLNTQYHGSITTAWLRSPSLGQENSHWHKHQFCLCRSSEEFAIWDSLGRLTPPYFLGIFALLIKLWYHVLYSNLITWHLLILPYPSWQAKLKQMLWVTEAWIRCLPRKPPLPVFSVTPFRTSTKSTVASLWSSFVFSWSLSKRLREIRLHLTESPMKLVHFNTTSFKVPQSHSSNIVLIKQFLIFYLLFLAGERGLSGKPRAVTRTRSWETELRVTFTAIIRGLSAQKLTGISFQIWACSIQTGQPPFQMQLVCFCGHLICHGRSRQTPELTAEHLLCSLTRISTSDALFCRWSPFLGHAPEGTPSFPFLHVACCKLPAFWLFWFVVFFLFNPSDSDRTPVKRSWSPFCCGGKHIYACNAATTQKRGAPTPAQLHCSWWQCRFEPGTRDHSVGTRPSITGSCKCRRNRLCGREAEGGRVDLL